MMTSSGDRKQQGIIRIKVYCRPEAENNCKFLSERQFKAAQISGVYDRSRHHTAGELSSSLS